jgi:hypothetical protein
MGARSFLRALNVRCPWSSGRRRGSVRGRLRRARSPRTNPTSDPTAPGRPHGPQRDAETIGSEVHQNRSSPDPARRRSRCPGTSARPSPPRGRRRSTAGGRPPRPISPAVAGAWPESRLLGNLANAHRPRSRRVTRAYQVMSLRRVNCVNCYRSMSTVIEAYPSRILVILAGRYRLRNRAEAGARARTVSSQPRTSREQGPGAARHPSSDHIPEAPCLTLVDRPGSRAS